MRRLGPTDAVWLMLESRDTPMHVGMLIQLTPPDDSGKTFVRDLAARWLEHCDVPAPWNLELLGAPALGHRVPLMRVAEHVDLDYHVRRAALPAPGSQRELGELISRLHANPMDLHRPLWEAHVIEGLEDGRCAFYLKVHHAIIDGVSGSRMLMRSFTKDPSARNLVPFWMTSVHDVRRVRRPTPSRRSRALGTALAVAGLGRATIQLAGAALDERPLSAPYRTPGGPLRGQITGARRFATQQYPLEQVKALAAAGDCTLNDIVLWLCGTALRSYLAEHDALPERPLTAGIPVSLRAGDDDSPGTAIATMIAELGTDVADPRERLARIKASTRAAKEHFRGLPKPAQDNYLVFVNGAYILGLTAGLGARSPVPFSLGISNVPGPEAPLYLDGARIDSIHPISLLTHGNALNITCVSYAGTLCFGFTGARDALPRLQRLAVHMGDALGELTGLLTPAEGVPARPRRRRSARATASSLR